MSGAGIPKSEGWTIAGCGQGAAVGREGECFDWRGLVLSGFGLVGFEGFFRGKKSGLGFSDLGLNGEEVFGSGGAILESEFVGVAGIADLREGGIAFLASLAEFVSDFFESSGLYFGCFGGVENEVLALKGAFFLIEIVAGFGEGRGVGLCFVGEVVPLFFGVAKFAFGLVEDFAREVAFKLELFCFAGDSGVVFDFEENCAVLGIPDPDITAGVTGGDSLRFRMKGDGGGRFVESIEENRRCGGVERWSLGKRGLCFAAGREVSLPEFDITISAGGEELVLVKGKGVNEVAMGGVSEGGINEFGIKRSPMEVIDKESGATGDGGKAGLGSDGGGVTGWDLVEVGPFGGAGEGRGRALGTLSDPEFEQSEFGGGEVSSVGLILGGRHGVLLKMGGVGEDEAFLGLAGNEGGTGVATGDHVLRRFEVEFGLGLFFIMAGEAVLFQKGNDLLREIDLGVPLKFGYGEGGVKEGGKESEKEQSHGVMVRVRSGEWTE